MNTSILPAAASRFAFRGRVWGCLFLLVLLSPRAWAFPPAPHHLFYGMVRDEYGSPINVEGAEVLLETSSGTQWKTKIIAGLEPGVNYRLEVPMDAGLTVDLYKPTALKPSVPFQIKVRIGTSIYLPIELKGDFGLMGQPGKRTLLNLTLGEDRDGDGLPDAWERQINPDIGQVNPGEDVDGDGMTNLQEYLAGTYAFDPKDGFLLTIAELRETGTVMRFLSIRGRSYSLVGSTDLETWVTVSFRLIAEGPGGALRQGYLASDVRSMDIEAVATAGQPALTFYKLLVQ